ncbi:hypothetical protein D6C86_05494 [Aureobasidium pullulans]|uniref:Uncharacterized protein n=1 Tax=Aureobasidium pullulans TaxID=5580 RepID=A0A4S9W5H1_AURPU|nr:hypothetical protein D6C94_03242 [Aureobasidium pullulans]THZ44692.1 hypothetical protein D6C87_03389 [Aureobasidium pullulans]THZ59798.1 hypothetical protein D6C86_05494 [Aureobasidium pullulans]
MPYFQQRPPPPRFMHGVETVPLTKPIQTNVRPNASKHWDASHWALFVFEDIPVEKRPLFIKRLTERKLQTINKAIHAICPDPQDDDLNYWLADHTHNVAEASSLVLPPTWTPPFLGQSIEQAFAFLADIPEDIILNREYIAVLDKHFLEENGWVLLYHLDGEGVITCVPCVLELCNMLPGNVNFHEGTWKTSWVGWKDRGNVMFGGERMRKSRVLGRQTLEETTS